MFAVIFILPGTFFADRWKNRKNQNPQKFCATQYFLKRLKNCNLPEWHALA